jgi:hypothetical protein
LTEDERRLVEDHFQTCALCRTEQADLQTLAAVNRHIAVPELSAQASFGRLLQRIDSEAENIRFPVKQPAPRYWTKFFHALPSFSGFLPPTPMAFAATLVVLLLSAPAVIVLETGDSASPEASYRTLSNRNVLENFGADDIRVIFAENLDSAARTRLLAAVRGEIIDGPNARGLYLIRIAAPPGAEADITEAIAALRRETGVLFAEPALPLSAPSSKSDGQS